MRDLILKSRFFSTSRISFAHYLKLTSSYVCVVLCGRVHSQSRNQFCRDQRVSSVIPVSWWFQFIVMTLSVCVLICIHTPCISVTYLIDLNITETAKNRNLFHFFFFFLSSFRHYPGMFLSSSCFFGAVSFHHSFHCSINTIEHIFMSHDLLDVYVYCVFFFPPAYHLPPPPLFFCFGFILLCISLKRRKLLWVPVLLFNVASLVARKSNLYTAI